MASIPSTASLQAIEAVARRGSFALAASELHLTPSAVSHQVARLESQLGVRLFERNAHGVHVSASGERYLSRIGAALAAIVAATDDLQKGVSNSLYLHCSPSLACLWLLPRLRHFSRQHPQITLNFSAAHTPSDFALGQTDIDIRYGIPDWPGLQVEPLFEEPVLPMASKAFIRKHRLKQAQDLLHVPLIQSTVSVVQWSDWFAAFSDVTAPERTALRFDRAMMSIDAAASGLGVTLESATMAEAHLANDRLRPVFEEAAAVTVQAHYAVFPPRHAKRPAVAAFLNWLSGQAGHAIEIK